MDTDEMQIAALFICVDLCLICGNTFSGRIKAMAGWGSRWFGKSSAQRMWDHIPELRGVPPARAGEAYQRAWARLKWSRAWWGALLVVILYWFALIPLSVLCNRVLASHRPLYWISGLLLGALAGLSIRLFYRMTRRPLRRCVRAELGTHCPACDYDLRGTPDAIPPAIARCPECGKAIPRNVHRQTVAGSAPDAPAAAALLRRKGSE